MRISLRQILTHNRNHPGFTIVELSITVVVVAILAAVTVQAYNGVQSTAKDAKLKSNVAHINDAIDLYFMRHRAYPKSANFSSMGINDSTGQWPVANLESVDATIIKSPFDKSDDPTSMREEGGYEEAAHGSGGKIGYVSVIADDLQTPDHWTCWWTTDECTGWRLWYRTSDNTLHTLSGGKNAPL